MVLQLRSYEKNGFRSFGLGRLLAPHASTCQQVAEHAALRLAKHHHAFPAVQGIYVTAAAYSTCSAVLMPQGEHLRHASCKVGVSARLAWIKQS